MSSIVLLRPDLLAPVVTPVTYYVDQATGNNANNGSSEGTAWATITYGASQIARGDTLLVKNGTYTGLWTSGLPPAGYSWEYPTTIQAYPGHSPIITAGAGAHAVRFIGTSYVVFRGFEVDGTGGADGVKLTWGTGFYQAHHIRIRECDIHSFVRQGISGSDSDNNGRADGCEIIGNLIHDGGSENNLDHGIYFAGQNALIEGNQIYNCWAFGIHIYDDHLDAAFDNIVRENYVHDNAVGGTGTGILLGNGGRHLCYNNMVARNDRGIRSQYAIEGSKIYNNTIYDNNVGGPKVGVHIVSVPGCEIADNIIWGHATPISVTGTTAVQTNNLTADPSFLLATPLVVRDFHTNLGSAAINTGTAHAEVPNDYLENPRPHGATPDIGAYEFPWITAGAGAANLRVVQQGVTFELGTNSEQYLYHTIPAMDEFWVQFSVNLAALVLPSGHDNQGVFRVPVVTTVATSLLSLEVRQLAASTLLRFGTRDDAATSILLSTGALPVAPSTHLIDMHWRRSSAPGANDGLAELYVNGAGSPDVLHAALDNDTHTGFSRLLVGSLPTLRTHTVYDCTITGLRVGVIRGGITVFRG